MKKIILVFLTFFAFNAVPAFAYYDEEQDYSTHSLDLAFGFGNPPSTFNGNSLSGANVQAGFVTNLGYTYRFFDSVGLRAEYGGSSYPIPHCPPVGNSCTLSSNGSLFVGARYYIGGGNMSYFGELGYTSFAYLIPSVPTGNGITTNESGAAVGAGMDYRAFGGHFYLAPSVRYYLVQDSNFTAGLAFGWHF